METCLWCIDTADVEFQIEKGARFCARCGRNFKQEMIKEIISEMKVISEAWNKTGLSGVATRTKYWAERLENINRGE